MRRFCSNAFLVSALLATPAFAESWLTVPLTSYHLNRKGQNEVNLGLGVERSVNARWSAVGGFYNNSSGAVSLYGGAVYAPYQYGRAKVGLLGGLVSGYTEKPCILLAPAVSFERDGFGVNVIFIPAAGGVFGAQLKWRFD